MSVPFFFFFPPSGSFFPFPAPGPGAGGCGGDGTKEQRVQKLERRGRPAERSRAGRQRSPECRAAGARWNKQLATQPRPSAPARRPAACRALESAPLPPPGRDRGRPALGRGPRQPPPIIPLASALRCDLDQSFKKNNKAIYYKCL